MEAQTGGSSPWETGGLIYSTNQYIDGLKIDEVT